MIFVTVPRQSYTNILLRPNFSCCAYAPYRSLNLTTHLYAILLCYTDSETTGEYDGYIPECAVNFSRLGGESASRGFTGAR